LDYAGGYGLLVRLMRDKGYDFFREDVFCKNIFAIHHDVSDLSPLPRFELATAFEVFEHLTDPYEGINRMFEFSDSILFTTEIPPPHQITQVDDWWYFVPETGQHVSFYSLKSLETIAEALGCYFFTDKQSTHMYTRKKMKADPLKFKRGTVRSFIAKGIRKITTRNRPVMKSLIPSDFELARRKAGPDH
jgi:hypothetical protein